MRIRKNSSRSRSSSVALRSDGVVGNRDYLPKRFPFLFTGWFWFVGMLVPIIGIVQVGRQAHADRYTYLPLIGITITIVWLVAELTERWRFRKQIGVLASAVVIITLSACTYHQTAFWRT